MELRHLRYFIAVAEEGSVTVAAERRLHTAQPSLSRQMRDLELEVGVPLMVRGPRGIELTESGRAFLDHARLAVGQAAEAIQAARRASRPDRPTFAVGFLAGQESDWLPALMQILRADLPAVDLRLSSRHSSEMADDLQRGDLDLGFMRLEPRQGVTCEIIAKEQLVVVLPSDHRLATNALIDPQDLRDEVFVGFSDVPHVLRDVAEGYLQGNGLQVAPSHRIDNVAAGVSLVASTRGFALLPAYAEALLPWSVVTRPLTGEPPTIDIAVGYRADNPSPVLKSFLAGLDQLIAAGPGRARQRR